MASTTRNGLECRVGHGRIALPTEAIDQLGEYAVGARLPFSDRLGCAIGVWGEDPILSITLTQHQPSASRTTNGALLVGGNAALRCAFEIDEPLGLVTITELAKANPTQPWRRSATLSDGRSIQFIDVDVMLQELRRAG
jgi:hypothetical protein